MASTQELMRNVASQYRAEQKLSCNTPAPLAELHFFYEGPEVRVIEETVRQLMLFLLCSEIIC